MHSFNRNHRWSDPRDEDCLAAYDWLRAEISIVLDSERKKQLYRQQGNIFGQARRKSNAAATPATSVDRGRRMSRDRLSSRAKSPGNRSSSGKPAKEQRLKGSTARPIAYSRPSSTSIGGRRFSETRGPGDRPSRTPDGQRRYWRPGDSSKSPGGTRNVRKLGAGSRSPGGTARPRGFWGKDPRRGYSPKPNKDDNPKSPRDVDTTGSGSKPICFQWEKTGSCRFGANCRYSHSLVN